MAKEFLKKLYTKEEANFEKLEDLDVGGKISKDSKNILNQEFTEEEIIEAIKGTANRSPGPSGIIITLFKKFPKYFAKILKTIANFALKHGKIDEFLLKGHISLIPKKEDSKKVNEMRPISLLEIPRKIITKAMTNRLKKILIKESIISENQFCHPGRLIHENVLTLKTIVDFSIERKKELHGIFLDFEKAFDRVSHEYLIEILKKRGFGEKFINIIGAFLKGKSKSQI